MDCPKCETPSLESTRVRGVDVDRCKRCRGIWFDDNELSDLLDLAKEDLRSLDSRRQNDSLNSKRGCCPRDGSELLRVYSPKNDTIVLDTCTLCSGIWLDRGELLQLSDAENR